MAHFSDISLQLRALQANFWLRQQVKGELVSYWFFFSFKFIERVDAEMYRFSFLPSSLRSRNGSILFMAWNVIFRLVEWSFVKVSWSVVFRSRSWRGDWQFWELSVPSSMAGGWILSFRRFHQDLDDSTKTTDDTCLP
jgi:hypothetical protein